MSIDATAIIVAMIGALGLIIPAYLELFAKIRQVGGIAKDIRSEVKNSHEINLRDDLDEFRDEMRDAIGTIQHDARAEHAALWRALTGNSDMPTHPTKIIKKGHEYGETRE